MADETSTGRWTQEGIVHFLTMHRIAHGLTLRDVAEACSPAIAASTVMRYERQETTPTWDALAAWAGAMGFDLEVSLKAHAARPEGTHAEE
jgi:transcriptional regulator with XRE-family HTH domain